MIQLPPTALDDDSKNRQKAISANAQFANVLLMGWGFVLFGFSVFADVGWITRLFMLSGCLLIAWAAQSFSFANYELNYRQTLTWRFFRRLRAATEIEKPEEELQTYLLQLEEAAKKIGVPVYYTLDYDGEDCWTYDRTVRIKLAFRDEDEFVLFKLAAL